MKKIFTLLAALLVGGGAVASAEGNVLLVGEGQDYAKIEDAVAAASEGSTIKVTTDVEWKAAIIPSLNNLTIEAENGVTISCLMKNKRAITLNQALTITLKNLNLVYTEKDASTATLFESSKGGNMLKMENCKISNFKGTSNQGIICLKGGGKATLADVTFENNLVVVR